ncbi:MAG: putative transposase [Deltaproteobacteria bacterium]
MYFVSYLKNREKEREIDPKLFVSYQFETEDGTVEEYQIFERERVLKSYGRIRFIILLGTDGKQIPIMTSNPYLRAATVVYFLKQRWREENCFKYMKEHFGIDLLCTYKTERAPKKIIKRKNMERQEVIRLIQQKKAELTKLKGELGEKILVGSREQTVEEFFADQKQVEFQIKNIQVDIDALERKKAEMPTKTEIDLSDDHVIIAQKRRLFINAIKSMNYNAEKWLQIFFKEHHRKADETLSLIRSLWRQPGKIRWEGNVVEVVLERLNERPMQASLDKVLEKLKEINCLRLPDGKFLRIS